MLKIKALQISLNTDQGKYGTPVITFQDGLNIVKGFNATGKSTIFQAILYALGLEELIGGKNEKTMQSVLKSEVMNNYKEIEAHVVSSLVTLEVEGVQAVSIRRYVKSQSKQPNLVEVFAGKVLTEPGEYNYRPMYVHDKGAADDKNMFGFHAFLETLIGWKLPMVHYKDGATRKLYLQNIFPALVIEQKAGWTDFLATIPYYALIDRETRALEFLLNLDSWKNQQKKSQIKQEKQEVAESWQESYVLFSALARQIACEIKGVSKKPAEIESRDSIILVHLSEETEYTLSQYVEKLDSEYKELEGQVIPNIGDIAKNNEDSLKLMTEKLRSLSLEQSQVMNGKNETLDKFEFFRKRLSELESDKVQNDYHLKVKKIGAEDGLQIAHDNCPFCNQDLDDSLLPKDIDVVPMQIEDNIHYLKAQIKLIKTYIKSHEDDIGTYDRRLRSLDGRISRTRSEIRALKTQLTSDNRLPSVELIERKIKLKSRLDLYRRKLEEVSLYQDNFMNLSYEWLELLKQEKQLPKKLSPYDYKKIADLAKIFKGYLMRFNYSSKPIGSISISYDTFLPVVEKYSLKFDSAASDFIRTIWSYTLALKEVSSLHNGNHPNLFIIDEPGNQETSNSDMRLFLDTLGKYSDSQAIVFSSFKQSDATYIECTKGVKFNLIDLGEKKYIKKLDS